MRNPNGYGSVTKLSGNRRRPFWVKKTVGWNEKGQPISETIGFYETREEAMIALAQYNNDPWDVNGNKITFKELFELFEEKKMPKLGASNQKALRTAGTYYCKKISKMKYREIKVSHMQDIIDNCGKGYSTQLSIKNLFFHLDRFALELDITNHCYSGILVTESVPETTKQPFTDEEVKRLWEIKDQEWVDSVLFFLYTGFRISEFLDIKIDSVDLNERTIKGGTKTKAGKDRIVPIHSKIFELVQSRLNRSNKYLFEYKEGKKMNDTQYYIHWNKIMDSLGMNHTPHSCRHTFRSRLDSAGANKRCIDLMMGHKTGDVGERIYTHKTVQELKDAIELITS